MSDINFLKQKESVEKLIENTKIRSIWLDRSFQTLFTDYRIFKGMYVMGGLFSAPVVAIAQDTKNDYHIVDKEGRIFNPFHPGELTFVGTLC